MPLPATSGDYDPGPPPIPADVAPDTRYLLEMQAWSTRAITGQSRASSRVTAMAVTEAAEDAERRSAERHAEMLRSVGELRAAVGGVEMRVSAPPRAGRLGRLGAWSASSPVVRQALASALSIAILAAGGYVAFRLGGIPTTPTPVRTVDVTPVAVP